MANNSNTPYVPKPPAKPHKLNELPITMAAASKYGFDATVLGIIMAQCVPEQAKDFEIAHLLYQSARTGLDPMARQVYLVYRGGNQPKCMVQTGIDGYRLIADRTGQYAGSSDPTFDEGLNQYAFLQTGRTHPSTATVTVKKIVAGVPCDFTATAAWEGYALTGSQGYMWQKLPMLMLSKVAESLALRKAFPAQLSGIYTSEEMMQAGDSEGDLAAEDMLKDLGVLNKNAPSVIAQLEKVGLDPEDADLETVIGCKITEIPDTGEGNDLLKKIWSYATAYAKSKNKEVELSKLVQSL